MCRDFKPLSDTAWETIFKLMDLRLPPERGVPRSDLRKVWNTLFYVLRTGCRWQDVPTDAELFVPRSTAHGWLKKWSGDGTFDKVMSGLLQMAIDKGQVDLSQICVDGSFSPLTRRRSRSGSRIQRKGLAHTSA